MSEENKNVDEAPSAPVDEPKVKGLTKSIFGVKGPSGHVPIACSYQHVSGKDIGLNVEEFAKKAAKKLNEGEPVRGWLRFFVTDGAAELQGGEE